MNKLTLESTTVWACTDCTLAHANGEYGDERPEDLPEPLCLVDLPGRVSMGLLWEEHDEDCLNRAAGEWVTDCECETREFSTSQCELCGDYLHGARHAFTWWFTEDELRDV